MLDYIHVDDEVITDGAFTLEETVEECCMAEGVEVTESEILDIEVEKDPEEKVITSLEAARAMGIVRRFAEKNFADLAILKCSNTLDEAIYKYRAKNQSQKKLTDFWTY